MCDFSFFVRFFSLTLAEQQKQNLRSALSKKIRKIRKIHVEFSQERNTHACGL
jgi:hypothetical protein